MSQSIGKVPAVYTVALPFYKIKKPVKILFFFWRIHQEILKEVLFKYLTGVSKP